MNWFWESAEVVEPEPPETDEDRLAEVEREAIFSEGAFNLAVRTLREHNIAHAQGGFSFTNNYDAKFIITMANDAVRKRLERDERETCDRRNRAWASRAEQMMKMGLIR